LRACFSKQIAKEPKTGESEQKRTQGRGASVESNQNDSGPPSSTTDSLSRRWFLGRFGTPKTNGSKHLLVVTQEIPPGGVIPKHKHHGKPEVEA
jgi:hypothetical protein